MKAFLALVTLLAATALPALADAQSDVKNAMFAFAKLTSFHMTATAKGHTIDGDFVNPGKIHLTMGPMEMIMLDKTTYVKMGSSWRQFSIPGSDKFMAPVSYTQHLAAHKDDLVVTDLGPKTVDGALLHAYLIKDAESTKGSTIYLDASGEMVRIEIPEIDGVASVVKFSNFNAPISITAPV